MTQCLQFHFRQQPYRFVFRMDFFLLCLFFVILFCVLGVWQVHRYQYKKTLLFTYQHRLESAPVPFSPLMLGLNVSRQNADQTLQFQPVEMEGHYVNALTMLVQNQVYKGQMGVEVLTPLQIAGEKKLLLVDRGWVRKPNNDTMPSIKPISGTQRINGYIKILNEYQFILGKNIYYPSASPIVMQKIDTDEISRMTHQSFYPFILRLGDSGAAGYVRDWTIITVLPQRHMGYAVQWFLMAMVLFIAYFCFCCERKNNG